MHGLFFTVQVETSSGKPVVSHPWACFESMPKGVVFFGSFFDKVNLSRWCTGLDWMRSCIFQHVTHPCRFALQDCALHFLWHELSNCITINKLNQHQQNSPIQLNSSPKDVPARLSGVWVILFDSLCLKNCLQVGTTSCWRHPETWRTMWADHDDGWPQMLNIHNYGQKTFLGQLSSVHFLANMGVHAHV